MESLGIVCILGMLGMFGIDTMLGLMDMVTQVFPVRFPRAPYMSFQRGVGI